MPSLIEYVRQDRPAAGVHANIIYNLGLDLANPTREQMRSTLVAGHALGKSADDIVADIQALADAKRLHAQARKIRNAEALASSQRAVHAQALANAQAGKATQQEVRDADATATNSENAAREARDSLILLNRIRNQRPSMFGEGMVFAGLDGQRKPGDESAD
jgi:hypothetical protein